MAVVVFHLCILLKFIPYDITWGGRLQNNAEMYVFETISIAINFFLGFVLMMKGGYLKPYFNNRLISGILWIFFILFVLNTIGNSIAKTNFEKSFALLTLISAILIGFLLKNKSNSSK